MNKPANLDKRIKVVKKWAGGLLVSYPVSYSDDIVDPPVEPPAGYEFKDIGMGYELNCRPPLKFSLLRELDPIEKAWEAYWHIVDDYARQQFEQVVKPWLKRKGYDFVAGNGTWVVSKDNPRNRAYGYDLIDEDQIPQKVLAVLQYEVPGYPGNDLGSLMPDYNYAVDVQNNGE